MNDIIITKTSGGLGRREPSGDMISGLLVNGVAVVGGVQLGTVYRLKGVADALALLVTPEYDDTNKVLVYEHINEYFRINPNGDLYIMLLAQSVVYGDMVDVSLPNHAKKLLVEAGGDIRQLAVAYNPTTPVTDFSATDDAIPKAQQLVIEETSQHRPVEIFLEGKGFDYASPVDFRSKNSAGISVFTGQSLSVANKVLESATPFAKYAAIGNFLGTISLAKVNENGGWVQKFNLQGGSLQAPGINQTPLSAITQGQLDTLDDNGTIFFRTHIGLAGIYINDTATCTALTDDFAYIENNRTIHKAYREIRAALLPRLNSPVLVDGDTGQLSPEVAKSLEMEGLRALEVMLRDAEVSSIDVFVDPDQDILGTSELKVEFTIVPTGTARKITVSLGFTNPF